MKYLFLTLLFITCFVSKTLANTIEFQKEAIKIATEITLQDVYELEKSDAKNIKNYFRLITKSEVKSVLSTIAKDVPSISIEEGYCLIGQDINEIYDRALKEYKIGNFSYNNKFFPVLFTLSLERCSKIATTSSRQDIYNLFLKLYKAAVIVRQTPDISINQNEEYYLY